LHSQKLNEPPLTPWVMICNDKVVVAHCNCIAALGKACTHAASLLFLIAKTVKGLKSVTDTLAYWIGSAKKDVHLTVSEMHFRTQQKTFVSDVEQSHTSKKKTYDKKNI
jgi:16S rRNA G1207 methylase RsmC